MPSGIITGKTNIPIKEAKYVGLESDTAYTLIDNKDRTIKVEVKVDEVTKDCITEDKLIAEADERREADSILQDNIDQVSSNLSSHEADKDNPHAVTKAQVGLGNVDNTSDLDKPISTATQTALDNKQATLVSGENIKTINNESLLGSGNIDIESAIWGNISGTLDDQLDLKNALDAKANDNSVVHLTSNETIAGDKSFTGFTGFDGIYGLNDVLELNNGTGKDSTITISDDIVNITSGSINLIGTHFTYNNKNVATEDYVTSELSSIDTRVSNIEDLIPAQASVQNKLADKDFVNSSIATNTAYFLGTYNVVTDLGLTIDATHTQVAAALSLIFSESGASIPSNNDYVFVSYPDATIPTQFTKFERYKYNSETETWAFEYELNNSSFTAEQWAAINSGITSSMIDDFMTLSTDQTVPSVKTFTNGIKVGNSNIEVTKDPNDNRLYVKIANATKLKVGVASSIFATHLNPDSNNSFDLGQAGLFWRNLRLSGGFNPNTSGYKLTLPDTSTLTADSEILDTASSQTITGVKTIPQGKTLYFGEFNIGSLSTGELNFRYGTSASFMYVSGSTINYRANLVPNGNYDLGSSSNKWKDFYLSGVINPNSNGYALQLPDTSGFTSNQTIATKDDLDGAITTLLGSNNTWTGTNTFSNGVSLGNDKDHKITAPTAYTTAFFDDTGFEIANIDRTGGLKLSTLKLRDYNSNYGFTFPSTTSLTSDKVIMTKDESPINEINASDIVNNTLTQAQYDLITNGKPTRINGTLLGYSNMLIVATADEAYGGRDLFFISNTGAFNIDFRFLKINVSTKALSLGLPIRINTSGYPYVGGKLLPTYPTDTTKQYKLVQVVGGTLAYVEDIQGGLSVDDQTAEDYITLTSTNWSNLKSNHYYTTSVSGGSFNQIKFFPDEEESRYNLSIDGNDYNVRLSLNSTSEAKGMFVIKENGHAYEITIFVNLSGIASADILLRCATIY